jgi:hypothetical protein
MLCQCYAMETWGTTTACPMLTPTSCPQTTPNRSVAKGKFPLLSREHPHTFLSTVIPFPLVPLAHICTMHKLVGLPDDD